MNSIEFEDVLTMHQMAAFGIRAHLFHVKLDPAESLTLPIPRTSSLVPA